jgi:tetratricopeptide (TPR) repeat protein
MLSGTVAVALTDQARGADGVSGSDSTSVLDLLKEGYLAMDGGDPETSLGYYRAAVDRAKTSEERFQAYFGVGAAAAALARFDEAREAYRAALGVKPGSARTIFALAEISERQELWDEAASLYAEAAVRDPALVEALTRLGAIYARQGRHEEAAASCQRALAARPESQDARLCVAVASFHQGRYDEASKAFGAVVEANPEHGNAWYGLGLSRLGLRDQEGAVKAYSRLKEIDPELARDLYERIFTAR